MEDVRELLTPNAASALREIADGPLLCHRMTPYARGRLARLGLAEKVMIDALPESGEGSPYAQVHYRITSSGRELLASLSD